MNQTDRHRAIPILMYHSISNEATSDFRPYAVPPAHFAQQMAYLAEHGYVTRTVAEYIHLLDSDVSRLPEKLVIITFDDAFQDFLTDALPVLQRHQQVATVYVPTAYVGGTSRWMTPIGEGRRKLLSWNELKTVAQAGIELGAHSHTHPQMDLLLPWRARFEIERPKHLLEEHLGKIVRSFCYPHGYHSTTIKRMVDAVGYTSACAVRYTFSNPSDDRYALARLIITPEMSIQDFARALTASPSLDTSLETRAKAMVWREIRRAASIPTMLKRLATDQSPAMQ